MRTLAAALSLSLAAGPACGEAPSARRQAADAAELSAGAASQSDPTAASRGAAAAFRETTGSPESGAPPVRGKRSGAARAPDGLTRGGPQTFKTSAVPNVYAADKSKVYAADDKPPPWDYDGTVKSAVVALAGAAIGFALGGPIGACVGFLAGFFIGALAWKMKNP